MYSRDYINGSRVLSRNSNCQSDNGLGSESRAVMRSPDGSPHFMKGEVRQESHLILTADTH